MDLSKKVVEKFLNSGEGYFHYKRVLEDGKAKRYLDNITTNPYKYVRNLTKLDIISIIMEARNNLDMDLYNQIPSTALHAALDLAIWSYKNGEYQSKIDSNIYNFLYKVLSGKLDKGTLVE